MMIDLFKKIVEVFLVSSVVELSDDESMENRKIVELSNYEPMENRKVSWVEIAKKGENHK